MRIIFSMFAILWFAVPSAFAEGYFKNMAYDFGRGLENVKRRAKQINAVIDIHSENTGTVAELELEVAHLN